MEIPLLVVEGVDGESLTVAEVDEEPLTVVEVAEEPMTVLEVCASVAVAEEISMEIPAGTATVKATDTPWSRLS